MFKNMNCLEKIYNRLIEQDCPIENIFITDVRKTNLLLEIFMDKNDLDNFIIDVKNNLNLSIGPFPGNKLFLEIHYTKLKSFPQNTIQIKFNLNEAMNLFLSEIIKNLPSKLKILELYNSNPCDISNLPNDLVELVLHTYGIYNLDNLPPNLKKIKIYFNHYGRNYCLEDFINLPNRLEEIVFYTHSYVYEKQSITYHSYTELFDNYENFI